MGRFSSNVRCLLLYLFYASSSNFLYSLPGSGCLYSPIGVLRSKMDSSFHVGIVCSVYAGWMGRVFRNRLAQFLGES